MIADSSVIVAIVNREPDFSRLLNKLQGPVTAGVGAPTLAEAGIVIRARLGVDPLPVLDRFLRDFQITVIEFREQHWREAADAFARYGKGRHEARLNFGDCLS